MHHINNIMMLKNPQIGTTVMIMTKLLEEEEDEEVLVFYDEGDT
jgi:dihydroxyacetone kinase DhaKLM complex PTS-EIIA-like component DhaM